MGKGAGSYAAVGLPVPLAPGWPKVILFAQLSDAIVEKDHDHTLGYVVSTL